MKFEIQVKTRKTKHIKAIFHRNKANRLISKIWMINRKLQVRM